MMSYIDVLKKASLLQGLSGDQLEALLMTNETLTRQRHEVIFEEHSSGREIYVVLEGEVAIELDPARDGTIERGSTELRTVRTFGPGESFGEMAVLERQPRTATVVATQDNTKLLVISSQIFDNVLQAQTILYNIARDLSDKVRSSNTRIIENMLAGYFLTVLVENLAAEAHKCDTIIPWQQQVVIRNAESFILTGNLIQERPEKEAIEISLFAESPVLHQFVGAGDPSGPVIFNALFSIIRSGQLSARIVESASSFKVECSSDQRSGKLNVDKVIDGQHKYFTLEWQIKGARYDRNSQTASAAMFLYLYMDEASSTHTHAQQIIANIAMPVQKYIYNTVDNKQIGAGTRVIIIHHRSHETARTLQTIRELGYQIDSFIGIPYGEVNWDYITMLEQASDHNYMSLRLIQHPTKPTQYEFDFRQSSFQDRQTELDLFALFSDPAVTGNYLTAMQALAEYRLGGALQRAAERGERLIVYEDGGYIVAKIYDIYKNPQHRLHSLIKSAIDEGRLVGVVEVTVAGERKNQEMIEKNNGLALLPVLSNARSDIKAVFEAMGVAEAVIHASATALGRLGLPTFQARRIAVIGGNGAIGTRLIEQLTQLHNSAANIFAIARSERPFSLDIDRSSLPYAATRLKYRHLPRYLASNTCLPVILDWPYREYPFQPDAALVTQTIQAFLKDDGGHDEVAITNSYPYAEDDLRQLWRAAGYEQVEATPLENKAGIRHHLQKGDQQRTVTLLAESTIMTFENVSRAIQNGVDTVIGSTGLPIFSAKNLDDFFARPGNSLQADELVLISASSKDYEFRSAIDFLNRLLHLQANSVTAPDVLLGWFADFYKDNMSFLQGDDFAALQTLLAAPVTPDALQKFIGDVPKVAAAIGLKSDNEAQWQSLVADYIAQKIRRSLSLRKEIRADIGSIFHVMVNGQPKRVVLLADGLVINFFARHEKGVKTEYIDPIVTMQVLSLVKLSTSSIAPGLYKMDAHLRPEDLNIFWAAINDYCRPLGFAARKS